MAVISLDSAKGGVGKTTLSVNIAVDLALRGLNVTILDCDINQHATRFGTVFKRKYPRVDLKVVGNVTTANVLSQIREAESESDVVVIDLPAGTSELSLRALSKSQLVIIPAQKTVFDVRDATKTALQILDAEDVANVKISSVLVWSRVQARFETTTERSVRDVFLDMVTDPKQAVLKVPLLEYDAFAAGFVHHWVPRQVADMSGQKVRDPLTGIEFTVPKSAAKAAENMEALTDEVYARLIDISEGKPRVRVELKPDYRDHLRKMMATEEAEVE